MAKILVLGASGMLGHKVCQVLALRGHEVVGTVRSAASATRVRAVLGSAARLEMVDALDDRTLERLLDTVRPNWIVNAIGVVKQKRDAESRSPAVALNAHLPHRLADLCGQRASRLIHLSTDCVFDGTRGCYRETDPSDAKDIYGKSKFLGETEPSEAAALTLRASLIGREIARPTHGLIEWFLAQAGMSVKAFAQAIFTGFTTIEMSRILALIVEQTPALTGTVHVASTPITKFELLGLVKEAYRLDVRIERDEAFRCDRSLVMESFAHATGYTPPSWPDMVREMAGDPTPYASIQSITVVS